MPREKRLIVALDVDTIEEVDRLVSELHDLVGFFKVGMQLYFSQGNPVLERIRKSGAGIFLDLKLMDIPNTVAKTAAVLTRLGVSMLDFHASGGIEMMTAAVESVHEEAGKRNIPAPLLLGVTVLTSISRETLHKEIGIREEPEETVVRWAENCIRSGFDGVVTSGWEARKVKEKCGCELIVVPGVRPSWAAKNDQERVLEPGQALSEGASHLVVGRPITGASHPREAALKIIAGMDAGIG